MKNFLIVLLGPTGVGKTDLSIGIAETYGSEIISADSRQFFIEMRKGTAIPSENQLQRVKHHFIRFLPVKEYYSSSLFERDVLKLLPELFNKNNVVVMSGGSGMYINAVCNGMDEIPDIETATRNKVISMYSEQGIEGLRVALKLLDPEQYSKIDLKNHKRIMRALEICESTGMPYSSFLKNQKRERNFVIIKIGLIRDRNELYNRINARVDEMLLAGLEEEARQLYSLRHLNALQSVGYREFFDYFDGKISLEKAVDLIKRNSRRYAKRQLTWWGKDKDIAWFNPDEKDAIFKYIQKEVTIYQVSASEG